MIFYAHLQHLLSHIYYTADFVVIDIEEDTDIPLILGRPFMSTASYVVDMGKKMLQMGIEYQRISFDLFHEDKEPPDRNVCFKVHVMEERRHENVSAWWEKISSRPAWKKLKDLVH